MLLKQREEKDLPLNSSHWSGSVHPKKSVRDPCVAPGLNESPSPVRASSAA